MPAFSKTSKQRLATCHADLQEIFTEVVKIFDCTVLCGRRGEAEQNAAHAAGKSKLKYPQSMHNRLPLSLAVDVAPYTIDWQDRERMHYFAGVVKGVAEELLAFGLVSHRIRWGGDWDNDTEVKDNTFDDLVHFELLPRN